MTTYTLDVRLPNGAYGEDHGLTLSQIEQAKERAAGLGIEILAITEETPLDASALDAFKHPFQ